MHCDWQPESTLQAKKADPDIESIFCRMVCLLLSHLNLFISLLSNSITRITFPSAAFPYLSVLYTTTDHRDLCGMMSKDAYQPWGVGWLVHAHTALVQVIQQPSVLSYRPIDCPPALLCCVLLPFHLPPAPSIVRRGWTWDSIETGLAAEPDRNWRGIPQTINLSLHAFLLINAL